MICEIKKAKYVINLFYFIHVLTLSIHTLVNVFSRELLKIQNASS